LQIFTEILHTLLATIAGKTPTDVMLDYPNENDGVLAWHFY
jgi:hypothetical protein